MGQKLILKIVEMDQLQVRLEIIKQMNLEDKKVQPVWETVLQRKDQDIILADSCLAQLVVGIKLKEQLVLQRKAK